MRLPCKSGESINKYRTYLVIFDNGNVYGVSKIEKRKGIGRQSVRWRVIPFVFDEEKLFDFNACFNCISKTDGPTEKCVDNGLS